jgi:hypothetical protein
MRASNILIGITALVCGSAFADETHTNAPVIPVALEKATRLWISSFGRITVTAEHRKLAMPSTTVTTDVREVERETGRMPAARRGCASR